MSHHSYIQNHLIYDNLIEKPSLWKNHPNFKRKLSANDGGSSKMEIMYEISLFSDIHIPRCEEIVKSLDDFLPEDHIDIPSGDVEERDDVSYDEYSYPSYISYLVETSIQDDAIESRYIGLVNDVPSAINWNSMNSSSDNNIWADLVKCALNYDHDDEYSQVSQHSEFSTLWNEPLLQQQSTEQHTNESMSGCFKGDFGALCMPSLFMVELPEAFDERMCDYQSSIKNIPIDFTSAPTPINKISPCEVEERQDTDYILPISRSCDASVISKSSECSAVLNTLREKKRRLESQFMKTNLYSINATDERIEVCPNYRDYLRSKRSNPPPSQLIHDKINSNSKAKAVKTFPRHMTLYCCDLFSAGVHDN